MVGTALRRVTLLSTRGMKTLTTTTTTSSSITSMTKTMTSSVSALAVVTLPNNLFKERDGQSAHTKWISQSHKPQFIRFYSIHTSKHEKDLLLSNINEKLNSSPLFVKDIAKSLSHGHRKVQKKKKSRFVSLFIDIMK